MTQTDTNCRNKWADRIGRCLSSNMGVEDWCKLSHVKGSCLYRWLAWFSEEEPGRFPRKTASTMNWLETTRGGIADVKSVVPATSVSSPMALAASADHAAEDAPTPRRLNKPEDLFRAMLLELMEPRYGSSSTIFCTQHRPKDWDARLGGGVHARAIVDRIAHGAVWLEIGYGGTTILFERATHLGAFDCRTREEVRH